MPAPHAIIGTTHGHISLPEAKIGPKGRNLHTNMLNLQSFPTMIHNSTQIPTSNLKAPAVPKERKGRKTKRGEDYPAKTGSKY